MEAAPTYLFSPPLLSSFKVPQPLDTNHHLHVFNSTLLHHNIPTPSFSISFTSNKHLTSKTNHCTKLHSSVVDKPAVEKETEEALTEPDNTRRLYVVNLPWSLSVLDIKNIFGQCGAVIDVEIIKQKNGKSRGFAFVTMSSEEEAQTAIRKLDSHEVMERILRVEIAKRLKKPSSSAAPDVLLRETRHKLYISNLAWKVRSSHLREFFATSFNPVSARVVFDNPSGRSSGYGFVSFATKEEAEAALASLDGKELMGRPLRLKFSERNNDISQGDKLEDQAEPE